MKASLAPGASGSAIWEFGTALTSESLGASARTHAMPVLARDAATACPQEPR